MGVITLKIDSELEDKFRRRIGRLRGAARGAISQSVEEAIRMWLSARAEKENQDLKRFYTAWQHDKKVAEADSLEALSGKLKEMRIDPRDVSIESELPTQTTRKMGLRTTSITR